MPKKAVSILEYENSNYFAYSFFILNDFQIVPELKTENVRVNCRPIRRNISVQMAVTAMTIPRIFLGMCAVHGSGTGADACH